ncbi:MAG: CPBP family intramembrane metalloprotease [Lachnospiraceae bacterium]|nr:CPBP family intramembrane metalloprotease [Lachnospiraceae bacterium]
MKKFVSGLLTVLKVIIAILIIPVAQFLASLILLPFGEPEGILAGITYILWGIFYPGFSILFVWLFAKFICRKKMSEMLITKVRVKIKWVVAAFLLPLGVTFVYVIAVPGQLVKHTLDGVGIFNALALAIVFTGFAAGVVEEMVFRGLILDLLKERWNIAVAVIAPSVIFGFVHVLGMNFSIGSIILVTVAGTMVGIMFSLVALEGGSIWNSAVMHMVWNTIIIGGLFRVGINKDPADIYEYLLASDKFWITGGEFGIESALPSVVGYTIVAAIAFMMLRKKKK